MDCPRKLVDSWCVQQEMCALQRKKTYRAQERNELRTVTFHLVEFRFYSWCGQNSSTRRAGWNGSALRLCSVLRCKTEILCFSRPLTPAESCKMFRMKPMKITLFFPLCDLWCRDEPNDFFYYFLLCFKEAVRIMQWFFPAKFHHEYGKYVVNRQKIGPKQYIQIKIVGIVGMMLISIKFLWLIW